MNSLIVWCEIKNKWLSTILLRAVMAGASLEIMAASRPCLQTLQSQNYGKNKFRIQEKGKKWPNCSQRGIRVLNPLAPGCKWGGEPVYQRVCVEKFLGRDANYTKMTLQLLTDSLHCRATPCANCLRGQMLQLLPVTFFVLVSQNTHLDAHGNWPNLGYS